MLQRRFLQTTSLPSQWQLCNGFLQTCNSVLKGGLHRQNYAVWFCSHFHKASCISLRRSFDPRDFAELLNLSQTYQQDAQEFNRWRVYIYILYIFMKTKAYCQATTAMNTYLTPWFFVCGWWPSCHDWGGSLFMSHLAKCFECASSHDASSLTEKKNPVDQMFQVTTKTWV